MVVLICISLIISNVGHFFHVFAGLTLNSYSHFALQKVVLIYIYIYIYMFVCLFVSFTATPEAYGSSWAWGLIGALDARL